MFMVHPGGIVAFGFILMVEVTKNNDTILVSRIINTNVPIWEKTFRPNFSPKN